MGVAGRSACGSKKSPRAIRIGATRSGRPDTGVTRRTPLPFTCVAERPDGRAASQPTPLRILPPGAAQARGAPSAEEATPCISRLRPPPPTTTVSASAGQRCLQGQAPICRQARTVSADTSRPVPPTPRAHLHISARTGVRLHRWTDPGPQRGLPIRTDPLAGLPTRVRPRLDRPTWGAVHSIHPSRATPGSGRRARTSLRSGWRARPNAPIHPRAGHAHCRPPQARAGPCPHPQARAGPCPRPQARLPARPPSRHQEPPHRPEPLRHRPRSRHPVGPPSCRPPTPP